MLARSGLGNCLFGPSHVFSLFRCVEQSQAASALDLSRLTANGILADMNHCLQLNHLGDVLYWLSMYVETSSWPLIISSHVSRSTAQKGRDVGHVPIASS